MNEDTIALLSLEELFKHINSVMVHVVNGDSDKFDDSSLNTTLDTLRVCKQRVNGEGLFSKNEEMDDIQTKSIKFLYLDYFIGKCYMQCRDMKIRRANLFQGKDSLTEYLKVCSSLRLLHESEVKKLSNESSKNSAEDNRNYKIEKYKREKSAKARINEIQRLLRITKDDSDIDHEEELREMMIAQAQSYARDALDDLEMIPQEMSMLQFQDRLEESREEDSRERQRHKEGNKGNSSTGNWSSLAQAYDAPIEHKGIQYTKTFKVGDKLMMSRDMVHSTVFGSNITPPTMSLEEFGDQQLKEAREREEAAANAEAGPRRIKQLVDEGLEDDADLVEEAAIHDRAWDDWKDNNQKGSGNKMGKRF